MPNHQGTGTGSETVGGTGNTTPTWPTHVSGDLAITTAENNTLAPAITGWAALPHSPVAVGANAVLAAALLRATSSGESGPTIADPGNHCSAIINTFRNTHQTRPIAASATRGIGVSSTVATFPSIITPVDDCMVVNLGAWGIDDADGDASSPVNASLANLTLRSNFGTIDGDGGGTICITGEMASAGTVTETTLTVASTGVAAMTIALAPIADIPIDIVCEVDGVAGLPGNGDGQVRLLDLTQGEASYLVLDAASELDEYGLLDGSGETQMLVPYTDHEYIALYEGDTAGAEYNGVSQRLAYSGGFPTATIVINTAPGGGGGGEVEGFGEPGVVR